MSTTNPDLDPPSFSLDVTFSSDTQALFDKDPILAMGFGFARLKPGDPWKGSGQGPEKIPQGSEVYFSVYDTAPEPETVSLITLHFPGASPFLGAGGEPGTTIPVKPEGSQPGQSVGCNVVGLMWIVGPFTVSGTIKDKTKFEVTVSVTLEDGRVFQVDPEIIVDGGG